MKDHCTSFPTMVVQICPELMYRSDLQGKYLRFLTKYREYADDYEEAARLIYKGYWSNNARRNAGLHALRGRHLWR